MDVNPICSKCYRDNRYYSEPCLDSGCPSCIVSALDIKLEYFRYGGSIGVKFTDLQRLAVLRDNFNDARVKAFAYYVIDNTHRPETIDQLFQEFKLNKKE